MAVFQGIDVGGASSQEVADALIQLNRSLEYQMANLDDDNIKELDYSKMLGAPPSNADNTSEQLPNTLGINFTKIGVDYIYTGSIAANKIDVGTLTGFTIQTAYSGRRVVLDALGFRSYDSTNAKRISIENDGTQWNNQSILFYGSNGLQYGSISSGDTQQYISLDSPGTVFIGGNKGIALVGGSQYFDFANVPIQNFKGTAKFA